MSDTPKLTEPLKESMSRALAAPAKFDADIYHAMDKRDEALISDEILHGSISGAFVYKFPMKGDGGSKEVTGISVRGAAHLARYYGGLKHRMVASIDKRGRLFTFKSYASEGTPMSVHCNIVNELADEPDMYEVVVEITDIKTGNTVQVSRSENRFEKKSANKGGDEYERPNYRVIAESKAYRNAVLRLVPQDVQEEFKQLCIKQGKSVDMTSSVIDEKRDAVMKFAATKAIALTREQVFGLDWNQISGLSEAAREGIEAFTASVQALGLTKAIANGEAQTTPATAKKKDTKPKLGADEMVDPETGEIVKKPQQKPTPQQQAQGEPEAKPIAKPEASTAAFQQQAEEMAKPAFLQTPDERAAAVAEEETGGLAFAD